MTDQEPDPRLGFLQILLGMGEGYMSSPIRNARTKAWQERFYKWPEKADDFFADLGKRSITCDVYFCPTLLGSPDRKKAEVTTARVAWADLDTCDPSNLLVPPSIVVQSSAGRWQAYWILDQAYEATSVERLNKRIAYFHQDQGCDTSGWDLTQVLRFPGTKNHKYLPELHDVVVLVADPERVYDFDDFDNYPEVVYDDELTGDMPTDMPDYNVTTIWHELEGKISPQAKQLFENMPLKDWSKPLWQLELFLFVAGLDKTEVFAVCKEAACNKYARDNRPDVYLWREVCRAEKAANLPAHAPVMIDIKTEDDIVIHNLKLLSDSERAFCEANPTFVEEYIEWAKTVGDAAWQYHQAGAFVILSTLLAGTVRLPTSFGVVVPNLWFMILADTCQPIESKVLTPSGWSTIGELLPGDYVIGRDGKPTMVQAVSTVRADECYRITFKDGSYTECTSEHLWTAKIGGYERTVPLTEIQRQLGKSSSNVSFPAIGQPVTFAPQPELPIDPYILGVWLAEGCRSDQGYANFANDEPELIQHVRDVLPEGLHLTNYTPDDNRWKSYTWGIKPDIRLGPNPVRDYLVQSGLITTRSSERFVPTEYMTASIADRQSLLQGILDGDGHCMQSGNIKMDSTSKQLVDDTVALVRSLGGIARYNGPRSARSGSAFWTVTFTAPEGLQPFRLQRKMARVKVSSHKYKGVESIDLVGQKDVCCIKVEASDGLYVTDNFVVTHNTLTRKTTAMDMAMDMLVEVDSDSILATDGSIEGLMTSLSMRPGRPSIFLRDEFSGLLETVTKKDYYAGMLETFTKLYDGKYQKRVLRKETLELRDPVLIFFAGGIRSKILSLLNDSHVASGFLPRFVFITAESDVTRTRPVGPPTERETTARDALIERMRETRAHYSVSQGQNVPGELVMPKVWNATLTPAAWLKYNEYETKMLSAGVESNIPEVLTPTMDRLCKSGLKMAVLLAATERLLDDVTVTETDLIRAFYYIDQLKEHTLHVVANVGKTVDERLMDRILEALRNKKAIARSALMQNFRLQARQADNLFRTLEERGQIRPVKGLSGGLHYEITPITRKVVE